MHVRHPVVVHGTSRWLCTGHPGGCAWDIPVVVHEEAGRAVLLYMRLTASPDPLGKRVHLCSRSVRVGGGSKSHGAGGQDIHCVRTVGWVAEGGEGSRAAPNARNGSTHLFPGLNPVRSGAVAIRRRSPTIRLRPGPGPPPSPLCRGTVPVVPCVSHFAWICRCLLLEAADRRRLANPQWPLASNRQ